jgi:hypothetical protein
LSKCRINVTKEMEKERNEKNWITNDFQISRNNKSP